MATISGPKRIVSAERIRKRASRPVKIANMKWNTFISAIPAEKTKTLKGVGGGSMEGTIRAKSPYFSDRP